MEVAAALRAFDRAAIFKGVFEGNMENTPLDELLNDAPTAEPIEEQPVAEEPVEAGQPRDENGRFAPIEAMGCRDVVLHRSELGPWLSFSHNGRTFRMAFLGGTIGSAVEWVVEAIAL